MNFSLRRIGLLTATLMLAAGCSTERSAAPTSPISAATAEPSHGLISNLLGTTTALLPSAGVQRGIALPADITVSQTIGGAGGTLSIPAAGVMVTVPEGALIAPVVITMTARAGSLIAYDFAPHGITFAKPLVFKQSLSGTSATALSAPSLQLGYYADSRQLNATAGLLNELLGGTVDVLSWTFTGSIPHFSGYMIACGREE